MRLKKRILAAALSAVMVVTLAACGGGNSGGQATTSASGASSGAATSETPANAEFTLNIGHDHTTSSPFQQTCEEFKAEVEEKSGGRIAVKIYPAQQLGSSREMIEMMQAGSLECTLLPTAKFGGFDQRLNLADMPFLCASEEDFIELFNGPIGEEAMSSLPDIGIQGVAYFPEGYKYITNNVKPITKPDDLKGMKIRTMEAPIIMAMFEAWGANPVPIDFAEVYNSLQQNVVDGQENPLLSIHDMKFYEVQKYMTIDTHAYLSYFMSYSKIWLDSLPEDLYSIVIDATKNAKDRCYELMQEANANYLKTIEDSGVEIYTLSDDEIKAFKDAVQPVYEANRDVIGGDLLDRALAEAEKLAAN